MHPLRVCTAFVAEADNNECMHLGNEQLKSFSNGSLDTYPLYSQQSAVSAATAAALNERQPRPTNNDKLHSGGIDEMMNQNSECEDSCRRCFNIHVKRHLYTNYRRYHEYTSRMKGINYAIVEESWPRYVANDNNADSQTVPNGTEEQTVSTLKYRTFQPRLQAPSERDRNRGRKKQMHYSALSFSCHQRSPQRRPSRHRGAVAKH